MMSPPDLDVIRVAVCGARGRMGQEVVQTVLHQPDMRLVGLVDVADVGRDIGGLVVQADVAAVLEGADVVVDFTRGDAAPRNVMTAIGRGVACVVGTTGISTDDLQRIGSTAVEKSTPVLVAPNFALGAVLMMRFAAEAARHYEWAEIVELHHENKRDAPSGTALRTADLMLVGRDNGGAFQEVRDEKETLAGARGARRGGIRIHSVRLPGLVAHQEVILGGTGETLTIRHDSMSRASFMPGVMIAVRGIRGRTGLIIGLEQLL